MRPELAAGYVIAYSCLAVALVAPLALGLIALRHRARDRWVRGTVARADADLGLDAASTSFELSLRETHAAMERCRQAAVGPEPEVQR